MRVIDEKKVTTKHFDTLSVGEVFVFDGGGVDEYFMVIEDLHGFNAVDLWSGVLTHFEGIDDVWRVDATLTVKRG